MKKRFKWEPAAMMALVLGLGLWIAFGPASHPKLAIHPDALTQQLRIGDARGVLEATPTASGEYEFRILLRDGPASPHVYTREQITAIFGQEVVDTTLAPRSNVVFRSLNITSWVGVVWLGIGLLGQLAFSGRMVLQWIVSEKRRESVITESFWWFSMFGSVLLFSYFVWRQDPVALLGQASGVVIYSRNLRLIYKQRSRARRRVARDGDPPRDASPATAPSHQALTPAPEDPTCACC